MNKSILEIATANKPDPKIFVIVGKFATGKSSLVKDISAKTGIKQIITFTSRSPRENEVDGIDYHFVKKYAFNSDQFIAVETYNDWNYGICKSSLWIPRNCLIVVTPSGFRELKEEFKDRVVGIYLMSRTKDRVQRYMSRDSVSPELVTEMVRRLGTDEIDFREFEFESDYVVINKEKYQDTLNKIESIIFGEILDETSYNQSYTTVR